MRSLIRTLVVYEKLSDSWISFQFFVLSSETSPT